MRLRDYQMGDISLSLYVAGNHSVQTAERGRSARELSSRHQQGGWGLERSEDRLWLEARTVHPSCQEGMLCVVTGVWKWAVWLCRIVEVHPKMLLVSCQGHS